MWWLPDADLVAISIFVADWLIRLAFAFRVMMRRQPVPVTLAWLVVIIFIPILGIIIYLLVGESRLGTWRLRRFAELTRGMDVRAVTLWMHRCETWTPTNERYAQLARLGTAVGSLPPLGGNKVELLPDTDGFIDALIADIGRAQNHCHLLSYIWMDTGAGVRVGEALIRAAERGVACRVLVDAVGSKKFLRSGIVGRMRAAGVQVHAALPVRPLRMLFARLDLRNHRKIAVFDGRIAYTGSQNIADLTFRSNPWRDTGPWVDASLRIEGPAAQALGVIFLMDWQLDSGEEVTDVAKFLPDLGKPESDAQIVQVIASGPGLTPDAVRESLLMSIYLAREEIIMTTPYFVPDEPTKAALISAARSGVSVTVVLPKQNDSPLVSAASRSHYIDLLEAGVRILHFRDGLLHAKTLTVDRNIALVGSANIDVRSFRLNFEVTLLLYDDDFSSLLRFMQRDYMDRSDEVELAAWQKRPFRRRITENAAQLLGPLL